MFPTHGFDILRTASEAIMSEITIDHINSEESELLKKANSLIPKFSSNGEAILFYKKKLELFSKKYNLTIEELLKKVETENSYNENLLEVISLYRRIKVLENDNKARLEYIR